MLVTAAALKILKGQGYKEITVRGAPGSGKTLRMLKEYKDYDLVHIEQGINFETWMVKERSSDAKS